MCPPPPQKNLSRVCSLREDGEAVRERQGGDTRQLGEPGQEQSSSWCHHVFKVMFYTTNMIHMQLVSEVTCEGRKCPVAFLSLACILITKSHRALHVSVLSLNSCDVRICIR